MELSNSYLPSVFGQKGLSNGVDPDQTPQNAASDQSLHHLPNVYTSPGRQTDRLSNVRTCMVKGHGVRILRV